MMERSFRLEQLQRAYLEAFWTATGLPIGFLEPKDSAINTVSARGARDAFEAHCKYLHSLPGGSKLCEEDHWRRAENRIANGCEAVTRCHAGLYNREIPVMSRGQVRGVLMFGQMRIEGEEEERASLAEHEKVVAQLGLDAEQAARLRTLLLATKSVRREDLEHWASQLPPIENWFRLLAEHDDGVVGSVEKVAHEIQTRLQALMAHAQNLWLERSDLDDREFDTMIDAILYTSQALATVVRSMGAEYLQEYHFRRESLAPLLYEAKRLYEAEAAARSIEIEIRLQGGDAHPATVDQSRHHMQYAINNLVHNAVKYSFRGAPGRIRKVIITGHPSAKGYLLTIQNYGIGILPEEIQSGKIFEDGYQGKLTYSEYRTGTGKGLRFVKRVIDRHGGTIKVSSVQMGHDKEPEGQPHLTTFNVWLPSRQPRGEGHHGEDDHVDRR